MDIYYNYNFEKGEFNYSHATDTKPASSAFWLHNHDDHCEIIVFFKGNCEFRVEGSVYSLNPYDVIITQNTEMHKIVQKEPLKPYERAVFHIKKSFFIQNNCEHFFDIFTNRPLGIHNVIPATLVKERNIVSMITDIDKYVMENESGLDSVIPAKLIEIMYNLNLICEKSDDFNFGSDKIKEIIFYINDNISSDLSLSKIAEHFFISKYHLCHIFKDYSGLTINKYITYKRILKVRELVKEGWSLIDASMEAGFGNYSNFYKIYIKETGKSPKEDLKSNK